MEIKNKYGIAAACAVAFSVAALNGCNSSSKKSSDTPDEETPTVLSGNAIDGYIVGGNVFCDDVANGVTAAKGAYTCPDGTVLAMVKGGVDVGFSTETSSGEQTDFGGVLKGPATGKFITPLSTLAVLLASDANGNFDPTKLDAAKSTLAASLGLDSINLDTDPAENIEIARLNTQVSVIVSSFASTPDEYSTAMSALAEILNDSFLNQETFDISGEDAVNFELKLKELNTKLGTKDETMARTTEVIDEFVENLHTGVQTIEKTEDHHNFIKEVANLPLSSYAFGIYKATPSVEITERDGTSYTYHMKNYITPDKNNDGKHQIVLNNCVSEVALQKEALTVQKTLTDVPVDVGIRIESENDSREISVIGRGASVSLTAGDSSSINVKVPDGMIWNANGTAANGTKVYTQLAKTGDRIFSSGNYGIKIDFDAISARLGKVDPNFDKDDYLDLTKHTGDFKITFVIDGIKVAKIVTPASGPDIVYSAWGYPVEVVKPSDNTTVDSIYAPGWEGYFTITNPSGQGCGEMENDEQPEQYDDA